MVPKETIAQWSGWGTALKPAWEPIIVAMKPLDGTFAQNAQRHGVAGLAIDKGRIGTGDNLGRVSAPNAATWGTYGNGKNRAALEGVAGRWPANLILDEDAAAALDAQSGERKSGVAVRHNNGGNTFGGSNRKPAMPDMGYGDTGGASRFFYVAKASRAEREAGLEGMEKKDKPTTSGGEFRNPAWDNAPSNKEMTARNHHPTVKPLTLMRYLVRLTATPTGGVVLDPFMGSGTTGVACMYEGRSFIGMDIEPEYVRIAGNRIAAAISLPLDMEPTSSAPPERNESTTQIALPVEDGT